MFINRLSCSSPWQPCTHPPWRICWSVPQYFIECFTFYWFCFCCSPQRWFLLGNDPQRKVLSRTWPFWIAMPEDHSFLLKFSCELIAGPFEYVIHLWWHDFCYCVVIFCQVAPSTALAVLKSWGYAVDSKHHHILPVVSESINCFQSSLLEEPEGPIENNKIWVLLRGAHLYSHLVMQCDKTSEFWTALLLLHGHSFMKKDILIWCLN